MVLTPSGDVNVISPPPFSFSTRSPSTHPSAIANRTDPFNIFTICFGGAFGCVDAGRVGGERGSAIVPIAVSSAATANQQRIASPHRFFAVFVFPFVFFVG